MNNPYPQQQGLQNSMNPMKVFIINYATSLFQKYDQNRSGYLDVREIYYPICDLYKMYGAPPPHYNHVIMMMQDFDHNRDGLLDLQEFTKLLFLLNNIPY